MSRAGSNDHTQRRRAGRPSRDEPPAVTREAIIVAARRSIAARGYDATSVRGLARELGVSLSAVQHHFPRKEDLWAGVVETARAQGVPEAEEGLRPIPDVEGRLRAEIKQRVLLAFQSDRMETALLTDRGDGAQDRLEEVGRALRESLEQLRGMFVMAISRGLIRDIHLDAWFALLAVGVPAVASSPAGVNALLAIDLRTAEQQERFADGVADLLLNGVLPR